MADFCSLTVSGNNVTGNFFSSSLMTSVFCLVTANSHPNVTNGSSLFEFLGNDPYYPAAATDNRFSKVLFSPYYRNSANCVFEPNPAGSISVTTDIAPPGGLYGVLFYLNAKNISKYSKKGFLCKENVTILSTPNKGNLSAALTKFRNGTRSPTVKLSMYPYLFSYFGYEAVLDEASAAYFEDPPLDYRSPKDLTRRGGLHNKCSEKVCVDNKFKAHNGGHMAYIHDIGYEAEMMESISKIAESNLANEADP
jgi:hypothetical protein